MKRIPAADGGLSGAGEARAGRPLDPMESLRQFAERHRLPSSAESRGRCLHMTLELARHAHALGVEERVRLARWKVVGDPEFREHWALVWREGLALDMAAAQVDGDPAPVRPLASYPAHYGAPRTYVLAPLLACFDSAPLDAQGRYPRSLILRLHRRMFRLDFVDAARHLALPRMATASLRLGEALFVLGASAALERAIARLSRVLVRLD